MERVNVDDDDDVDNRHGCVIEDIEGGWKATVDVTDDDDQTTKRKERTFILVVRWFITAMLMMLPVVLALAETLCWSCRRIPS
jgi:hypothetical protein